MTYPKNPYGLANTLIKSTILFIVIVLLITSYGLIMKNRCPKCRGEGYYWSDDGEFGENQWKCERCKGAGHIDSIIPDDRRYSHIDYSPGSRPQHDWGSN